MDNSIVTPEAVALDVDLADAGSRIGAFAIDFGIQLAIIVALAILFAVTGASGLVSGDIGGTLFVGAILLVYLCYFPLLEGVWHGRTVGKRALHLRVVRRDGQPMRLGSNLLRNSVRLLDNIAFIGLLMILVTPRHQRLGDLAGGTIVVHEGRAAPPAPVVLQYPPHPEAPPLDTAGLTNAEYALIRSFLERRFQLDREARERLAARLAGMVRAKVAGSDAYGAAWAYGPQGPYLVNGDEALLEAALTSVRMRYQDPQPWPGWAVPPESLREHPDL
ncbi:MAG: RDD family protein [Actinomycetota bacterium]